MCARCSLRPARVYLFVFPTHCLHHSFLSLSFIPPPPFVRSLNPSHLVLISVAFSLPLALSHKNMHMHPSIHPHTQLARASPRQAARFGVGLCKEIQKKKKKFGAAPLPNGVSMATKGAWPYNAVSNKTQDFKP